MLTETPTLETPQADANASNDQADNFDIMKFAADVDAGKTPAAAPETTAKPDAKPTAETNGATAETDAGKKGKETATPSEKGAAEPKPESAYTKAQKERARQENLLKNFQQEKEAFRQERAAFQAELEGLRREVKALKAAPAGPAKDENGFSADQWDQVAKKYASEGNDEMAEAARQRADKLRRQAPVAETSTAPADPEKAWQTPEFQKKWAETTDAILKEEPALADPANPLVGAVNNLVNDKTWGAFFRARPDGLRAAVEVAKLTQRAAQSEALQKELETTKKELERLTKLTQPRGSLPAAPVPGKKSLADMSPAEADAYVRSVAAAADGVT